MVGLYLNALQHAGALCVNEKSAIGAFDRKGSLPALSLGRAERYGFEHFGHGTLSLCARPSTRRPMKFRPRWFLATPWLSFVALLIDIEGNQ